MSALALPASFEQFVMEMSVPACKIFLPAGQNPAEDVWVFQKGAAYFYIQLQYQDAGSTQVFDDIMTSFNFTG